MVRMICVLYKSIYVHVWYLGHRYDGFFCFYTTFYLLVIHEFCLRKINQFEKITLSGSHMPLHPGSEVFKIKELVLVYYKRDLIIFYYWLTKGRSANPL